MKWRIKGITYDMEKSKLLLDLERDGDRMRHTRLYETPSGHFFILRTRFYFKGRRLPANLTVVEFARKYSVLKWGAELTPLPDVGLLPRIEPISRRRALALVIRGLLPRTFHKDLARYLK